MNRIEAQELVTAILVCRSTMFVTSLAIGAEQVEQAHKADDTALEAVFKLVDKFTSSF